jgi:ketosteroid isomerase-like protein
VRTLLLTECNIFVESLKSYLDLSYRSKLSLFIIDLRYARRARIMTDQGNSTGIHEAIAAADQKFTETFNGGDAAGLVHLYTENGQLLPPGSDLVTGAVAIQAFWQGAMDMGIKNARLETVEAEGHGDTAIEIGKYLLSGETGNVMDRGKYVVIWKQVGGQWKLHRDIWNSSLSAQGD